MTALSADRNTAHRAGDLFEGPVAAATTCYVGALLVRDSSGNVEPGTTATGKTAVGRCEERADNSAGAAAAINAKYRRGMFKFANSSGDPVTKANVGSSVYIEDDQTVCATGTGKSAAGIMHDIETDGVWVEVGLDVAASTGLLAANNLSDVGTVATARSNLGLDTGDSPTFVGLTLTGAATVATTLGVTGITTPIGGVAAALSTTLRTANAGCFHTGGVTAIANSDGFDATPVVTEIYYSEIFVPCNTTVTGIAVFNGSVASDDWHRALLDQDGDKVTGSDTGAVTSSGTDVYQKVPFSGGAITLLGPATYYVAQICDGTTDRYNAHGEGTAELGFNTAMVAGKITGQTYGAIPATNTLTKTFTTDLGPIASLY